MFRWFVLATLVACLSISIHYRRRARKQGETIPRSREQPHLVTARALLGIPLWGAIFAYVLNPRWMEWASLASPAWTRWVGVGLGLLSVPATYWVFSSLGKNVSETILTKEHHELVTHGAYRWIRHPLYTTGITLILGIGLAAANWLILLLGLIALASIRLAVIPLEEERLVATFGDDYRAYARRTGAMLPRIPTPR